MTNQQNHEPANRRCGANRQACSEPSMVHQPVPLCRNHAIEVALAILPAILGTALANPEPGTPEVPRTRTPMHTIRFRQGERAALEQLRASGRTVTWRSVAEAIRNSGGTCSNQRAQELCRFINEPTD